MFVDKHVLSKAISLVLEHKHELDKLLFESVHFKALNIKIGDDSKENLKKWFILVTGPGWRARPPLSLAERREMLKAFDKWYDKVVKDILPNYSGQDAVDKMIDELVKIKWVGYKVAGVYLRDIVYYFKVWPHLTDYLYLPIDRHVRDIMVKRLKAFSDADVPEVGESYFTGRNKKFQQILNTIHKPRVEFDYFWYIGVNFCSYHLCNYCWIKELCREKEPI